MARKMYVTNDVGIDEQLAQIIQIDPMAAMMWPHFIPHFDDWGRQSGSAWRLKGQVFPNNPLATVEQIEAALKLYAQYELIERYEVGGKPYMAINREKWFKIQVHIHSSKRDDDSASLFPRPPSLASPARPDPSKEPAETTERKSAEAREVPRRSARSRETPRNFARTREVPRDSALSVFCVLDSESESVSHKAAIATHAGARVSQPSAALAADERAFEEICLLDPGNPEDAERYAAARALLKHEVNPRTISQLLNRHSARQILQQAEWLPFRNPPPGKEAQVLVAAIRDRDGVGYEPPPVWMAIQDTQVKEAETKAQADVRRADSAARERAQQEAQRAKAAQMEAIQQRWLDVPEQKREAIDLMALDAVKRQSNFMREYVIKHPERATVQNALWAERERLLVQHDFGHGQAA